MPTAGSRHTEVGRLDGGHRQVDCLPCVNQPRQSRGLGGHGQRIAGPCRPACRDGFLGDPGQHRLGDLRTASTFEVAAGRHEQPGQPPRSGLPGVTLDPCGYQMAV